MLHALKASLTLAYDEGLLRFVPSEGDAAAGSRLVVVIGAFVFVEAEGGIGSGIDTQGEWLLGLLAAVLYGRSPRKYAATLDKYGDGLDADLCVDVLLAIIVLARPEIVPSASVFGKVATVAGLRDPLP